MTDINGLNITSTTTPSSSIDSSSTTTTFKPKLTDKSLFNIRDFLDDQYYPRSTYRNYNTHTYNYPRYGYSSRTISVLGLISGLALVILIITLSSIVRRRKIRRNRLHQEINSDQTHEIITNYLRRQRRLNQQLNASELRDLDLELNRASPLPPPSYDDVVTAGAASVPHPPTSPPTVVVSSDHSPPPSYPEALVIEKRLENKMGGGEEKNTSDASTDTNLD